MNRYDHLSIAEQNKIRQDELNRVRSSYPVGSPFSNGTIDDGIVIDHVWHWDSDQPAVLVDAPSKRFDWIIRHWVTV